MAQRLVVPDCDVYIPSINQEIFSASKQMQPPYPALGDIPYKMSFDPPPYYQLAMNSAAFSVDYSMNSDSTATSIYQKPLDQLARSMQQLPEPAATNILDLSIPAASNTHLDSTWYNDLPDPKNAANRYYSKHLPPFQPSTLAMSRQILDPLTQETPGSSVSTSMDSAFETRKDDNLFRFKNLWDCIYPSDDPSHDSVSQHLDNLGQSNVTTKPIVSPPDANKLENLKAEVSLKEMMDIDDLDMGDISNILNIPAGSTKSKPSSSEEKSSFQPGSLPNLSSFLRGIEYL